MLGHQIQNSDLFFWTAIVMLIVTFFCSLRLRDSRLGRAWIAIREDETAAAAMGIPLMRTKTWAYASGAFFGGMAGAYYASQTSGTFPDDFYFNISVFVLCMVILGGMGNVWGVILGAGFLAYLNLFGLGNIGAWINTNIHIGSHHPNLDVPLYASGIYGVIIVSVMLFRPEGLLRRRAATAELTRPSSTTSRCTTSSTKGPDGRGERPGHGRAAEGVRRPHRRQQSRLHRPARSGRVADRPQRRRQDDLLQHADGDLQADRGDGQAARRRRHRQTAARDHRAGCRPDVPEHPSASRT